MKKVLLCGMILCGFLGIFAGHLRGENCCRPKAMPPLSWLNPDVRIDLGDPAGEHSSVNPQIAVQGDSVFAVWVDDRNGSDENIFFNRSLDRGATWMPYDIQLDSIGATGSGESWAPRIALSGDHVYVVWRDNRDGQNDIYFNCSGDRGTTWLAGDVRLDTGDGAGDHDSSRPRICAQDNHVYAVWQDRRNGENDIYMNHSADYGATWLADDIRLDRMDSAGAGLSDFPQICCSHSHVYVTWNDRCNGAADIYFICSPLGGNFESPPVRLDTGDTAGSSDSFSPKICCSGANVYVTWQDLRVSPDGIFCNRSTDNGATWLAAPVRVDREGAGVNYDSGSPRICCCGNNIYAVWIDQAWDGGLSDYTHEVYFNASRDGGLNWGSEDIQINRPGGAHWWTFSPRICCSGEKVHIAWSSAFYGAMAIYFTHSPDGGASWLPEPIRLNTGDVSADSWSDNVEIGCSASNVFANWEDWRNGSSDIYFSTTEAASRAHAGADVDARTGWTCTLDGGRSSDPDKDPLTFTWNLRSRPAGSTAILSGGSSVRPTFVPDQTGEYEFGLTVTDPFGKKHSDLVTVTATNLVELTLSAGTGGTTVPAPGTRSYNYGQAVKVKAVPDRGFMFSGWSGDAAGMINPMELLMDRKKTVTALFDALIYPPQNLSGECIENRSLSMAEYIVKLAWQAHPGNVNVSGFRVTRLHAGGEKELGITDPGTFVFREAGVPREGALIYRVYTLRSDGSVSDPAEVTIQ